MLKRKHYILYVVPVMLLVVTGCGSHSLSPSSDKQQASMSNTAVKQFNQQEQSQIQSINQSFVQESNLFKEMSTKQISYGEFKSAYTKVQSHIKTEISSIRNASAPVGATNYQKAYISLLNEGLQVFADQEKAILSDGGVDKQKVSTVRSEMKQFESDSQQLAAKYGVN